MHHSKIGLNFTAMEPEFKDLLADYKDELTHFQSDDILVNLQFQKVLSVEELDELSLPKTQRLLKASQATYREIGIHPFCQSLGVVQWVKQGKTIETVVYLRDVQIDFRKKKAIQWTESEADYFINPFFERWFRETFEQDPPAFEKREELVEIFESNAYNYSPEVIYYGNFHPQRYELLKELEELLSCEDFSQPIQRILGHSEQTEGNSAQWSLSEPFLFEFDSDQAEVLRKLNQDSVTVQGPPGTGKSQVISNLIGACLRENKKVLVISEKKSALQVIQQKLAEQDLGFLCSHLSFHANAHAFYEDLKTTWERLTQVQIGTEKKWVTFEKSAQLAQQFSAYKSAEKELGFPFSNFQKKRTKKTDFSGLHRSAVPAYAHWLNDKKILQEIATSTFELLPFLNKTCLDIRFLTEHITAIATLKDCQKKYQGLFDLSHLEAVQRSVKMALVCHQFQGAIYEKYGHLLGKGLNELKRDIRKWKELQQSIDLLDLENNHWKQEPSVAELKILKIAAEEKGWLANIRWKRMWKFWTRTPDLNPLETISSKEKQLKLRADLKKRSLKFESLGINSFELELPVIEQLIHHISMEDWNWFQSLPSETRLIMAQSNRALNDYLHVVKSLLTVTPTDDLLGILNELTEAFESRKGELTRLEELSNETFEVLKSRKSIEVIEEWIQQQHWNTYVSKHPYMLDFEIHDFKQSVKKHLESIQQESKDLAVFLMQEQARKFSDYHRLLQAPLSKLNDEEKIFRSILRKGKSILVKEFAKTRHHLSIRELRSGEAKYWVDVLKPIQLSNPSSLASIFPMEKDQFDLVIFDEAGQIPMSYALGALQRAKRVLIAGDHQQMSPSSYFKQSEEVVIDVLHQSAFYLPHILLTHHYRSRDERLIAFSNRYFYGGRLRTFAEYSKRENNLKLTFVPKGEYCDGVNVIEAKVVAQLVEKALFSKEKYGVVAFSEAQLKSIHSQLSPKSQQQLEEAIEKDQFFFKALEQVQGEECDHLIVGFAYGKNQEGKFDLRFGPINLKNGEKRLNVLFSRARKSIHFVSSVKQSDFSSSKNPGVMRLKDWFTYIEEESTMGNLQKLSAISFESLLDEEESFLSFLNRCRVLHQRNWEIF